MPLDPSIPLQAQTPTFDIPGIFGKAQSIQNAQTQNQLQQAQLANAPIQSQLLQQQLATSQTDQQLKQLQVASTHVDMMNNLLTGVTPDNYVAKVQYAQNMGVLKPGEAPPAYDPNWVQSRVDNVKATKAKLDQALEQAQIGQANATTRKTNMEANAAAIFSPQGYGALGGAGGPSAALPTQQPSAAQGGAAQPSATPVNAQNTGAQYNEGFLSQLSPAAAAQVKGIAKGDLPLPSGRVLTTPYGQSLMNAVMQYDPSASAINLPARQATRKSFVAGPDANNITAINTAIAHLGSLSNAFDTLDNSSVPGYNTASNFLANNIGLTQNNKDVQAHLADVNTYAAATANELAKVFRSTGMSESDIKEWQKDITTSATPDQSKAVIQSAINLMDGRLQALGQKYNQGMGTAIDPMQLLSPEAQKVYNTLKNPSATHNSARSGVQLNPRGINTPLPTSAQLPAPWPVPGAQGNAAIQQKVNLARQMGYSDAEIQQYLAGAK